MLLMVCPGPVYLKVTLARCIIHGPHFPSLTIVNMLLHCLYKTLFSGVPCGSVSYGSSIVTTVAWAVVRVQSLAREFLHATGAAKRKKKKMLFSVSDTVLFSFTYQWLDFAWMLSVYFPFL